MGKGSNLKKSLITLLAVFFLISCTSHAATPATGLTPAAVTVGANTPSQSEMSIAGEIALSHVSSIADGIGARPAGTEKESQTAQYIVENLQELGYTPETQPFTFVEKEGVVHSTNVIAVKEGESAQEIIVGAHYDSVQSGTGADDNASGVGVVLEVAKRIRGKPTPYTIRFIFLGAEEVGLQGSKYYAGHMQEAEIKNTIGMINLDSLIAGDHAYVYGDAGAEGLIRDWSLQYAKDHALDLQTQPGTNPDYPPGTTGDWSDHAPFKEIGILYTYFESTNWMLGDQDGYTQVDPQYGENGRIWHSQYDTLEYIDQTFPGRVKERLSLFATVLEGILTEYQLP